MDSFQYASIMNRSAAKFWWKEELPKDVAHVEIGQGGFGVKPEYRYVYWKELMDKKREKQHDELNGKRFSEKNVTKPAFIRVFFNDTFLFYGWFIYIVCHKKDWGINFRDQYDKALIVRAMEMYPCGVLPMYDNFEIWAAAFAGQYPHIGFKRKSKQGLAKCTATIDCYGRLLSINKIKPK